MALKVTVIEKEPGIFSLMPVGSIDTRSEERLVGEEGRSPWAPCP